MLKEAKLPQEIIIDILSRLPAKSLCRFKCLSNPFRTLISDPHFTQKHLNSHTHQENVLLISQNSLYSIDFSESFDNDATATKLNFPSLKQPDEWVEVLGSCNGLVLVVSDDEENQKYLVNPTTRELKKISVSPFALNPYSSYIMYGLGYDSYSNDYKIVTLNYYVEESISFVDDGDLYNNKNNSSVVSVFSLKSSSWREIGESPYNHSVRMPSPGVFVNGCLHWLACSVSDKLSVIVAFNVADEMFGDVPPPSSLDNDRIVLYELAVLGGCLCMIVCRNTFTSDVWVMKEYGLRESWTQFTIVKNTASMTELLCLSKDGEVLLETGGDKLVVYNPKEKKRRNMVVHGIPDMFDAGGAYVESLVSPNCSRIKAKHKASRKMSNTHKMCSKRKRSRSKSRHSEFESCIATLTTFLEVMAENSKKRNECFERHFLGGNASGSSRCEGRGGVDTTGQSDESKKKLQDAIACLGDLKDVDGKTFSKAFNKLCHDPIWRDLFLRIPDNRKKDVVMNL